jgi:hypothetical protein
MSYGITSTSQIIDIDSISSGISLYKSALKDFESCGNRVIQAGDTCTANALSIDSSSLQYPIGEVGKAISNLTSEYSGYADEVLAQAKRIYSAQVAEYNAYIASKNKQNV